MRGPFLFHLEPDIGEFRLQRSKDADLRRKTLTKSAEISVTLRPDQEWTWVVSG